MSGDRGCEIESVVIADHRGDEVAALIGGREPGLRLRVVAAAELCQADLAAADALITFDPPPGLDFSVLKWLHCSGAGVDQLSAAGGWPEGVVLTRTTGTLGEQIAEYCLAHMLAARQNLRARLENQRRRQWRQAPEPQMLAGSRALVVGAGLVGGAIARRLSANGVDVTGAASTARKAPGFSEILAWPEAAKHLGAFDWVILALPSTPATRGMVGAAELMACGGAWLINVGRGAVMDYDALLAALDKGNVAGAILDVFPEEPLAADSPFWHHPRVTVTPHVAALTRPRDTADDFLAGLACLRSGERPPTRVDPQKVF